VALTLPSIVSPKCLAMVNKNRGNAGEKEMAEIITIRLVDEENTTIKVVGVNGRNIRSLIFLRSALSFIEEKYKKNTIDYVEYNLSTPGVYILMSEDNGKIYIGQSDNILDRLKIHRNDDKIDYWTDTMVFASEGTALNISQIKYLEHKLIGFAKKTSNVDVEKDEEKPNIENKQNAKQPNINTNDKITADNYLEVLLLVLKALGFNFFENKICETNVNEQKENSEIYYIKAKNAEASMIIKDNRYIVLKGSKAEIEETEKCPTYIVERRKLFLKNGKFKENGNYYLITEDLEFKTSSAASTTIKGGASSGREDWKNKDKKSLKDLDIF
jgi:hypothetical protein